ncbi:MAG TPA: SDR family oxidoreductase [Blastocatellia bacterium]|nr:SDR family oxidoreductase [Blastocatellia bacterium]
MTERLFLVTGGAGFIGSHIVERLLRDGQSVRVLDNFSTGKEENLAGMRGNLEVIKGDVGDAGTVECAMKGAQVAFHQAALGSVPRSVEDPVSTHRSNVDGTMNVLLAAHKAGVKRVVYASSSSVYGETAQLPKHEEIPPEPLSPYALSKLVGEYYCSVFHRVYGVEAVSLRYFNIFGPRQDPNSQYSAVIPRFVTALLDGSRPVVYGDGRQTRDFTYVENVVEANLLAAEREGAAGGVFNIACGGRYSLMELLSKLAELVGREADPVHESARAGDVRDSQASIERAKAGLGYQVTVGFEEGLKRTVEWYRSK